MRAQVFFKVIIALINPYALIIIVIYKHVTFSKARDKRNVVRTLMLFCYHKTTCNILDLCCTLQILHLTLTKMKHTLFFP